jgi:hypothetical protein
MSGNPLAKLDKARTMLAECRTLPEVKKIRDIAASAKVYAKAAHLGRETLNYAGEIKLLADHKAGELMKQLQKSKGGDSKHAAASVAGASEYAQVLEETRTPDRTARFWQKVAELPSTAVQKYVAHVQATEGAEITTKGLFSFHSSKAVQLTSETNEWYTLAEYIEAARAVLGEIDLDPASVAVANQVVKAKRFFTLADDGLRQIWKGCVWLNPPWGDEGPKFVQKLLQSYAERNVTAAVLLVNSHATSSKWFQPLWDFTLCFTCPRIRYWQPDSNATSPNSGSVFIYFGADRERFKDVFSTYGAIVVRL